MDKEYESYYKIANTYKTIMPDVTGLPVMDAMALLENMNVKVNVKCQGQGTVKSQSVNKNTKLKDNQTIVLEAS